METNQTAKMVAWLDEERRKDKALITKLEERATSQTALITDQARRIQELEGEITTMRATILTSNAFDESVTRLRTEFNTALEQLESRRGAVDVDVKKLRDTDREALMKAMEELRQEVITRIDRAIQPRRSEEERLSRVAVELQSYADNLNKGLEEFERSLTFLEEQRRQDSRRLSDVNAELDEGAKRVDGFAAKLELLEDLSRRNERAVSEITSQLAEIKQQRQAAAEEQALADQQRERMMTDMIRRMDSFTEDMDGFSKQVQNWGETHRDIKLQVEDWSRLVDRVERRLNETAEAQRLSEERFRQEWEEFLGDDQKRWRQFTLTNEESWRENSKTVEAMSVRVTEISERGERQEEHLRFLSKAHKSVLDALSDQLQTLREQFEDGSKSLPPTTT